MGVDGNISDLISAHEHVDWHEVPQVSPAEAAAWTQRLIEARDDLEETNG
jgi:hypothetical protein